MKFAIVLVAVFACALGAQKGFRLNHRNERVVGGNDASVGQFPHQISLQWGFFGFYQHVCGATIVSPTWIVTAAHCKTELPDGDYQAVAGIANLNNNGQAKDVVEIHVHPSYQGGVNPNDIALMRVSSAFSFNDNVQPASLPVAGSTPTGDSMLSGWGSTSTTEDPIMPNQLQWAALPVISQQECIDALIEVGGTSEPLADSNVCTGPLSGGQGACSGDSGGPLVQGDVLIGVVSWGFMPCGSVGAPSVFTKTSSFIDFITQYVSDLP